MWARLPLLVDFFGANIRLNRLAERYVCNVLILNKENETWVAFGVIAIGSSIALAAYGRHTLTDSELQVRWFIAVEYMREMGLGLLVMAVMRSLWFTSIRAPWPERILLLGMVLFSGVLLIESIAPEGIGQSQLRFAQPLGGILMMASWLWFLIQFLWRKKPMSGKN